MDLRRSELIKANDRFISENEQRLDRNITAYFVFNTANKWLGTRLEFVGTCVVSLACLPSLKEEALNWD